MCDNCGCGQPDEGVRMTKPGEEIHGQHTHTHTHTDEQGHEYTHTHDHGHDGSHDEPNAHVHVHHDEHSREIQIGQDIMYKNNMLAERNRGYFDGAKIFALNLVSSPGSGKTSLLERTIRETKNDFNFFVIEGDQQTMNDANRIHATGAPVIQINTGNACHLDADMIAKAVKNLEVANHSVLFIENVGNLVCPSLFDLGEDKRVVVISVTEGEDKPVKYPNMFASSHLCIINKTDLLPYVDFNVERAKEYALRVNHHLEFLELSVTTGEGMDKWYNWIKMNSGK